MHDSSQGLTLPQYPGVGSSLGSVCLAPALRSCPARCLRVGHTTTCRAHQPERLPDHCGATALFLSTLVHQQVRLRYAVGARLGPCATRAAQDLACWCTPSAAPFRTLPYTHWPLMVCSATAAAWCSSNLTKADPALWPVALSLTSLTSVTVPAVLNRSCSPSHARLEMQDA